ncbi:hypothetical protein [Actinoplanes sp. RD1]|uniref:hypothetical protein n=1 Tax=Actinoplanes sp. RD1 TaxID=3064538 RepID=UPI002740CF0D|nr:hypothetical protein [Actinoplanes sp. RD1]
MRTEDGVASRGVPASHITLERGEEETVELGARKRSRFDRRTRMILAVAAIAAAAVNAGAGWTYWRLTGDEPAAGSATAEVVLQLRGRSDYAVPLRPGATGDLTVTVANANGFPIRIAEVRPGTGNAVADAERRDAGCERTGVAFTRPAFPVDWRVAANNVAVFTVPGGLSMSTNADPACRGGYFTIPVQASGDRD